MSKLIIIFVIGSISLYVFFDSFREPTLRFNHEVKDKDFKRFLISKYQKDYNYSKLESTAYVTQLYKENEIHGLDLNNDGVLEVEVGGGYNCYDTSCGGDYYLKTDRGYKLIFDSGWIVALDSYTNGFRDLRFNPNDIGPCTTFGWNCDSLPKYRYDGNSYKVNKNKKEENV